MEKTGQQVRAILLEPVQVAQLRALGKKGMTWPGDLLSKTVTRTLLDLGLVTTLEGYYTVTCEGTRWLRMAGFRED